MAIVGAGCLRAGRKRDVVSSGSVTSTSPATSMPPEVEVRGPRYVAELLPRRTVCELDDDSHPHRCSRTWLYRTRWDGPARLSQCRWRDALDRRCSKKREPFWWLLNVEHHASDLRSRISRRRGLCKAMGNKFAANLKRMTGCVSARQNAVQSIKLSSGAKSARPGAKPSKAEVSSVRSQIIELPFALG